MPQHNGSCHCGAVRFTVDAALDGLMTCNCSICGRTGFIYLTVDKGQFTQTSGQDALSDYQFGSYTIHHVFCRTCGVRPFAHADGQEKMMVNVRCLEGVDPHALSPHAYDGRSR